MQKTLKSSVFIRFQDCDPFNHLNNARYIDYFINTREDQITKAYNLNIYDHIKKTGQAWVVSSNQIIYLKPAMLMEEVTIESQIIDYSENSLKVEMKMWDKEEKQLKSIFWISFIYFNIKSSKSISHPKFLLDLFKQVKVENSHPIFEDRCKSIINEVKNKTLA